MSSMASRSRPTNSTQGWTANYWCMNRRGMLYVLRSHHCFNLPRLWLDILSSGLLSLPTLLMASRILTNKKK